MTITITCRITDHQTSNSLSSIRVEAWNAYASVYEPVASALADGRGTLNKSVVFPDYLVHGRTRHVCEPGS